MLLYLIIPFLLINISLTQQVEPDMGNLELIFAYRHIRLEARGPSSSYNSLFIDGVDEFRVSWIGEGDGELPLLGKR